MFGFLIKKTFFDMYDNLIVIALLNVGFILGMAFCIYLPWALRSVPLLAFFDMRLPAPRITLVRRHDTILVALEPGVCSY